ncbi:hypothetical protein D3C81_1934680 [compost metagenome]
MTTLGLQGDARGDMPRILHPHPVLGVEQEHAQQVERLLGPGHDHYLLGRTVDPASIEHVVRDRRAQGLYALQFAIAEHRLARFVQVAVHQALPHRLGKCIVGTVAGQEGSRAAGRPVGIADALEMAAA